MTQVTSTYKVILIDDAEEMHALVAKALGSDFDITWAATAQQAYEKLHHTFGSSYDAILLDVLLPDGDGFQIAETIQSDERLQTVPLFFLTAKTGVNNRVAGFSRGADDYIEKPFDFVEFRTRVENRIRKNRMKSESVSLLKRGPLQINLSNQSVKLIQNQSESTPDLTPLEFKILFQLVREEGQTLSRERLMTGVWGDKVVVADRTIDKHISSLRQKLGVCAGLLETVPGMGYRFASSAKKSA